MLGALHVDGAGPGAGPVAASDESNPRRCDRRSLLCPRKPSECRERQPQQSSREGVGEGPAGLVRTDLFRPGRAPPPSCIPDPSVLGSHLHLPGLSLKQQTTVQRALPPAPWRSDF